MGGGGYDLTELGWRLCGLTVYVLFFQSLSGAGVGVRNDPDLLLALKTAIKFFNIYSTPIPPPNLFPSSYRPPHTCTQLLTLSHL